MPRTAIRAADAATLASSVAGCASLFPPTARDDRFEAADTQVPPSRDAEMRVRLVHLPDNRPVSGAAITEHRFTMLMSHCKMVTTLMVEGADPPPRCWRWTRAMASTACMRSCRWRAIGGPPSPRGYRGRPCRSAAPSRSESGEPASAGLDRAAATSRQAASASSRPPQVRR